MKNISHRTMKFYKNTYFCYMKNKLFKHAIMFEMDEVAAEKMMESWERGDPRCRFQPGARVMKVLDLGEDGLKHVGAKGNVEGCMYNPAAPGSSIDKECYLILWDGDDKAMLTVGAKVGAPL